MILVMRKVSGSELKELHQNPEEIMWFLYGEESEEQKPGFAQRFLSFLKLKKEEPKKSKKEWIKPSKKEEIDLDKAWQGIHFLLTGTDYEGNMPEASLFAGKTIGDIEIGYGAAMSLDIKQVQAFDKHLQGLDINALKEKYNPEAMKKLELYPDIFVSVEENPEPLEYLMEYFNILKDFVHKTALEKSALILYLT